MDNISKVKPNENQEKIFLSWKDYLKKIDDLTHLIKHEKYSSFYGIPRGGLLVATFLSYKLNVPLITDINKIEKNTLIVDEIIDSGKTIDKLLNQIGNHDVGCLDYRSTAIIVPKYFTNKILNDKWIIYPYNNRIEEAKLK
jgi:hypoxanthine phosphoribosyltransferase